MPDLNANLTKSFKLRELLASQYATRNNITEQFNPSPEIVVNLQSLCDNVLQPLRDEIRRSVCVSSGYRCPRVNTGIGGAPHSQHLEGRAADITVSGKDAEWLFQKARERGLPFDQLIQEFDQWVHLSYDPSRDRREVLRAYKDVNGITRYTPV